MFCPCCKFILLRVQSLSPTVQHLTTFSLRCPLNLQRDPHAHHPSLPLLTYALQLKRVVEERFRTDLLAALPRLVLELHFELALYVRRVISVAINIGDEL